MNFPLGAAILWRAAWLIVRTLVDAAALFAHSAAFPNGIPPLGVGRHASHVISVYYLYTHLSAILSEATVFCVTGGHRG